jgi:hypothetical protein
MTNELVKKPLASIHCNVCDKQVDEFRIDRQDQIVPVVGLCGVIEHAYTGYYKITYTVRCHGEEWKVEELVYEPNGERFTLRRDLKRRK